MYESFWKFLGVPAGVPPGVPLGVPLGVPPGSPPPKVKLSKLRILFLSIWDVLFSQVHFLDGVFTIPQNTIPYIGTEFLIFHCFATKMLLLFCKSMIPVRFESSRRDL